jgi:putative endonuclease
MAAHNELGQWGEEKAADYLRGEGYVVRHRDWKFGHRDLDLVAMDGMTLVFVEVKTRRNNDFSEPEQAVDWRKMRNLAIAANAYVKMYRLDFDIRFDIVSVVGTSYDASEVHHIKDAFVPPAF